jgi:hypothetical protein
MLHPGQQPAHGRAVADPDVGQPPPVHVRSGGQQIDGPAQVDDELDLPVPVGGG